MPASSSSASANPASSIFRYCVIPLIAVAACWLAASRATHAEREDAPKGLSKRTLWVVEAGYAGEPLRVAVGDMIQFNPFKTPLVPKFLDAELKAKISGDVSLEPVGSTVIESKDGKRQHVYFLMVRSPGESLVHFELIGGNEQPMPDYQAEFRVQSE